MEGGGWKGGWMGGRPKMEVRMDGRETRWEGGWVGREKMVGGWMGGRLDDKIDEFLVTFKLPSITTTLVRN